MTRVRRCLFGVVVAAGACQPSSNEATEATEAHRRVIATSVDSATRAFEAAERAGDAEAVIAALSPDAGVASFTFRDRVTDSTGTTVRLRGATTLVWERRDGRWRITYADADHYPDDGP